LQVYAPGLGSDGEQRAAGVVIAGVRHGPLFGKVLPGYRLVRINATDTSHMTLKQVFEMRAFNDYGISGVSLIVPVCWLQHPI